MSASRFLKDAIKRIPIIGPAVPEISAWARETGEQIRFRLENPAAKLLPSSTTGEPRGYSQCNQDFIVLDAFFQNKTDGFFVDVGANDPTYLNNTLLFEQRGWNGLALDPLPEAETKWRKAGRKAKFFPIAASSSRGTASFHVVEKQKGWEDMLSGMSVDAESQRDKGRNVSEITVETIPLKELFDTEGIQHVDYLSLDVEGHEMDVLQGIDFDSVHIQVLTVENNSGPTFKLGDPEIRHFMKSRGFRLYARFIGMDDIYVNKTTIQ